jgi:hypothetical protein
MRVGDLSTRDGKITTEVSPKRAEAPRLERPGRVAAATATPEPSPFARILQGLGREVDRGETLVQRIGTGAQGGKELGNLELLSLQAGVYRYSEAVDLAAKLVDRATNGVKTVLQGQ